MSSNSKAQTDRHLLAKPLRSVLWPRRWLLVAVVGLILLTSLLEGISLSLIVPLMQTFTDLNQTDRGGATTLFEVYQGWLARYTVEGRLAVLGVALIALYGLKNGLQHIREVLSIRLWMQISTATRLNTLATVLHRPYRYFLDHKQGALVQHLYHEPHHVACLVQVGVEQVANLIAVVVLIALLVAISWEVTVLLLVFGACFGFVTWWLSKRVHAGGQERQKVETEAVSLLSEMVAGIRQVKVFSAEDRLQEVYRRWVRQFHDMYVQYSVASLLPHRVTELFWISVLAVLLCLPALGIIRDFHTVLPLVAVFSAVALRVGPYVSRISQGWLTMKFLLPALSLVSELMEGPARAEQVEGGRPFSHLSQGIHLQDVSFAYGKRRSALSHVSAQFNRGEITAIIGPSGAGKSTLADLLVRLYEPSGGVITVDGVELREYDRASWLAAIGFVSQDTFIFHGTIRENLAFSRPEASNEEVEAVARQANAHDFIVRAPQGYETIVGDRGLKLSGGERQRLAIARALIRNPQILIFDEATSALDNQSEAVVQDAIASIARNRTVILIAHRLSTVVRAHKIVVLEQGTIVEQGTHDSLLKEGGLYAALYSKECP